MPHVLEKDDVFLHRKYCHPEQRVGGVEGQDLGSTYLKNESRASSTDKTEFLWRPGATANCRRQFLNSKLSFVGIEDYRTKLFLDSF